MPSSSSSDHVVVQVQVDLDKLSELSQVISYCSRVDIADVLSAEFQLQDFDAAREQAELQQLAETADKFCLPKVDLLDYRDAAPEFSEI